MSKQRWFTAWTTLAVTVCMSSEVAAQTGKGSTPNGRPFQQVQSQFSGVYQRIHDLQTHITDVETGLQRQIADINASLLASSGVVASLDDAVASINKQMAANAATVAALAAALGSLDATLAAVKGELAMLQAQVAAGSGDAAENTAAILALQAQVTQLQAAISSHTSRISALESQTALTSQFLTNMANGTCAVGQAIADIGLQGALTCVTPAGGTDLVAAQLTWAFGAGTHGIVVNCPLGYKTSGGGFDGAAGLTVVGSFPTATAYVVRVSSSAPSASIQAFAKCVK
jgi:septal ring factor EnvC (AmiA/AmiB activator)